MWLSKRQDLFNSQKTRNQDNTYQTNYNCGGYALRTFSWFYPADEDMDWNWSVREDHIDDYIEDGYDDEDVAMMILDEDVDYMLEHIKTLSLYEEDPKKYEPRLGEELIAYCIYVDSYNEDNDFHFKVLRDGKWMEKNGGGPIQETLPPWEIRSWHYTGRVYDSEVVYFINKVGEIS